MQQKTTSELKIGIGTILANEWGYSMQLVDFYKVIKETDKTLLVERIGLKETSSGYMCGYAIPDENGRPYKEEKLRVYKKVSKHNDGYHLVSKKR